MKSTLFMPGGLFAATAPVWAAAADVAAMLKLAAGSGCMTCHRIDPGAKGLDGLPPIGPAWPDVAAKYWGANGAPEQLTRTVMTGSNPQASRWKGKVSGLAMLPNEVAFKEADACVPFGWVLAQDAWK